MSREHDWIKLYRKLKYSSLMDLPPLHFRAFILLLLEVEWRSFEPEDQCPEMPILPGQLWSSHRKLGMEIMLCAVSSVPSILNALQGKGLITWRAITGKGTLITIPNWGVYQSQAHRRAHR